MTLDPIAKALIGAGLVLILGGFAWHFGWIQSLRLGRLPGDFRIERENFRFYFPLTSGLLLSAALSLLARLFR